MIYLFILGYLCHVSTSTNFNQQYINNNFFLSQGDNGYPLASVQERQPCASLIYSSTNNNIVAVYNSRYQYQLISNVYISFDIYFKQTPSAFQFAAGWGSSLYFLLNDTQIASETFSQETGCSFNYYKKSYFYNYTMTNGDFVSQIFRLYPNDNILYLSNVVLLFYYQCSFGCKQCNRQTGDCSMCINGFQAVGQQCIIQCQQAQYKTYDTLSTFQSCKPCIQNCIQCSNGNTCVKCANGYFITNNLKCQACFNSCQTCSNQYQTGCQTCKNNYYPLQSQINSPLKECFSVCPNNYYFAANSCSQCNQLVYNSCFNCANTCRSCSSNQKNICLDCYYGMELNSQGQCQCKSSDSRNLNFYYCSFENIAVVQAIFSNSIPVLNLEFGLNLVQKAIQCNQIFDSSTLNLLGSSLCQITSSQVVVTLSKIPFFLQFLFRILVNQLGDNANIMANSTINLITNAQILQFQGALQPIDTIYLISIVQEPLNPNINVKYNEIENSCNDINFSIQSIQNDAGRKFLYFEWILQSPQSYDQQTLFNLNTVIRNANSIQSQTLTITKYLIPPDSSITIQLFYILKVFKTDTLSFTTFNQKNKQITVSSFQNKYPPIFRYINLQITFQFYTFICDQTGPNIIQEIYEIEIVSQTLPSLSQNYNQYKNQEITLNIEPYQIEINQILDIQIQASISDNKTIKAMDTLSIPFKLSDLQILIQNDANMLVSFKSNITLSGLARDYELQDPNTFQGIQLNWSCMNLQSTNGDNKCYTYLQKVYIIPQNVLSFTIQGGTFNPYQTLQFTFSGQKDIRSSQSSVLLILAEIDIPPLIVQFDNPPQTQQVNINEDIYATLVYGSNIASDILTYAGAVLYDNNVVGSIKFDFYKVKFRIWDYFSNINANNPVVQIRFTVYNPQNIMPSLSITNFNINIPPQNCVLSITPQNGQALLTQFIIQFSSCTTINNPLTYQFFYYIESSDLQQEILIPQKIVRRQFQDQSKFSQVTTFLPSGSIVIMGQAIDSYLAVYNTTIQVNVSPYSQIEQNLLNLLDDTLSKQSTSIKNLCIIGEEISKNVNLYNLESVQLRKLQLIQALINSSNQLPSSSFLSTFSNKIIANLQASLKNYQGSQIQIILDQVDLILQKQEQLILNGNKNNKLLNNNDIILQNLVDSFRIVNSTTQTISEILYQSSMNNGNRILRSLNQMNEKKDLSRFLASQIQLTQLQEQMSLCDQIGNLLNNITFPNQGLLQLQGNLISISTEQITSKNLENYMYFQNEIKIQKNDSSIYNVVMTNYSSNPLLLTAEFQKYLNELKNASQGIQISLNSVQKPFIQNIYNNQTFNNSFSLKFQNIKQSKYNLTCLSQEKTNWVSSNCNILNSIQPGYYTCFCKDQQPTTIIEDLEHLLYNKNIKTAFGSQGLENISQFSQFYEYATFWVLLSATIMQIGLCYYGTLLDSKNQITQIGSLSTVSPMSEAIIADELKRINQDQQIFLQKQEVLSIESDQEQKSPPTQQEIETKLNQQKSLQQNQLLNQSIKPELSSQRSSISMQQNQDLFDQKNLNQQNQQKLTEFNQSNQEINIDQEQQKQQIQEQKDKTKHTDEEVSQKHSLQNIEDQNKEINERDIRYIIKNNKNVEKIQQSSFLKQIILFHNFASIFYVYNSKYTRPFRFTIFYLRVVHSLSISVIYDQQYNEQQILLVSLVNSIIIQAGVAMIEFIYQFRKIGRVVASFLMFALLILYFYIIFSIISGQSQSYSNVKISYFFIIFGVDFLLVLSLTSLFNIFIFNQIAKGAIQSEIMLKLLTIVTQIKEIVPNLSI